MKIASFAMIAAASLAAASPAHAYDLPPYKMTAAERAAPAEDSLAACSARLEQVRSEIPLGVAESRRRDYRKKLTPAQRKAAALYPDAAVSARFWGYVVGLKRDLAALHGTGAGPEVTAEADEMAKRIVQRLYDVSQEYDITGSAIIQNMLINSGARKKGFCYHYVNDLMRALRDRQWRRFDLHWGEAWAGTGRENNSLVVTAAGRPFDTGIAVDAWRSGGKPFWTRVRGDRFPWREAPDVEYDD